MRQNILKSFSCITEIRKQAEVGTEYFVREQNCITEKSATREACLPSQGGISIPFVNKEQVEHTDISRSNLTIVISSIPNTTHLPRMLLQKSRYICFPHR